MDKKKKLYDGIKNWLFNKFDELEVKKNSDLYYLYYKNDDLYNIRIFRRTGKVYYYYKFRDTITKKIRITDRDFEILLAMWVEEKFNTSVTLVFSEL